MIPRRRRWIRQAREESSTIVKNLRRLAVNWLIVSLDCHAVRITDRLMTEADTKNWNLAAKKTDEICTDAAFFGRTRTRRNHQPLWIQRTRFIACDRIIANHMDRHRTIEHAEGLHEIPGERVVVVDEEQH